MSRFLSLSWGDCLGVALLIALAACALVLLIVPSLIVVAVSFTETAYITFPPRGFTLDWYVDLAGRDQIIHAAGTSLRIALLTMVVCLLIGVPAAFALVRGRFWGRGPAAAFLLAPQMLPGMVIGIAILFFGAYFAFRQSDTMVTIGLVVFCLPFAVRMVMARLAGLDPRLDEASAGLGASSLTTFMRITVPQIVPAILAAATFVFIEAFDNLTVALFTASPRSRPLAVELYNLVQFDSSPVVAALSSLEILLALLIVLVLSRTVGLDRLRT